MGERTGAVCRGRGPRILAGVAALLLAITVITVSTAPPARAAPSWTAPVLIDPASPATLNAISCPSTSLCVGVDGSGDLVSSSNPTGGAGAWTTTDIDGAGGGLTSLSAVSCPSSSFCAAVDDQGDVLWTASPGNAAMGWSSASIASGAGLSAIACPSTSLCVAVDGDGNVYTSTDPLAGGSTWRAADIDGAQCADRGVMSHRVAVRRRRHERDGAHDDEPRRWGRRVAGRRGGRREHAERGVVCLRDPVRRRRQRRQRARLDDARPSPRDRLDSGCRRRRGTRCHLVYAERLLRCRR